MANIKVALDYTILDGQPLTFRSPADCSKVTGLVVYYPEGGTNKSKTFQFADAHGNNVGSIDLFAANVLVKVILDTEANRAYVQNADTNAYLEGELAKKYSPTNKPTAADVGAVNQLAVYYSGDKNVDDLTDPFALISMGATTNKELYDAVGGTFAYVLTLFYANVSTESRRMQVAWSYNANPHKMAFRIYAANGWQPWTRLADDSKVLPLDGSKPMAGALAFASVSNGYGRIQKSHSDTADYGTFVRDYDKTGAYVSLAIQALNNKISFVDKNGQTYNLYHQGNKPTAADVGAAVGGVIYSGDMNELVTDGHYRLSTNANLPGKAYYSHCIVSRGSSGSDTTTQLLIGYKSHNGTGYAAIRGGSFVSGVWTWTDWYQLATTDYAVNKAGDTMMGVLGVANYTDKNYLQLRNANDGYVAVQNIKPGAGEQKSSRTLWLAPATVDRANGLVLTTFSDEGAKTTDIIYHTGNVTAGTTDITAGSALATGSFYDVYE